MEDDDADSPSDEGGPSADLADRVAARRGREADATAEDDAPGDGTSPEEGAADETPAESAPLSDLARRVGDRRESRSADGDDALFDEMDVRSVDEETLWTSLTEPNADDAARVGTGASAEESREDASGHGDHVVPKAEFCEQCPHLADPPELACDHDGTEIVEVTDADRFRVRNCPMVDDAG